MIQKTVRGLAEIFLRVLNLLPGFSFSPYGTTSKAPGALRRAGTTARSPMDGRKDRDKDKVSDGDKTAQEVQPLWSLHVAAFLLSVIGLWPSLAANLLPDTSRRRVYRRLLANQ